LMNPHTRIGGPLDVVLLVFVTIGFGRLYELL
jgi:hypothetical protein